MQAVSIATKVVSFFPSLGEVYLTQLYEQSLSVTYWI
jgi:hypothetical protein